MIAVLVSSSYGVEIRKVARVGEERNSHDREEDDSIDDSNQLMSMRLFSVAFVEVSQGFSNEQIEKGENRKEVAKSDGEVARDAHVAIKQYEKDSDI